MAIFRTLATGLLGRSAGRRLTRAIPNPALRYLAIAAATTVLPMVVRKLRTRAESRRLQKTPSTGMRFPPVSQAG